MFYFGPFGGMHIWWFIWPLFFIFLFAYRGRRGWRGYSRQESPLDILMKRFAAGEITKEEYEERKKILERDWK